MIREKLEKLYDIGSSKRVFQSEWRSEGVPFYRAREIAKLAIDDYVDNELFIDEELYDSYVEKYGKPQPGDIMVTGVGTLGVCYIVKPDDKFYFKDGNILWFKQKAPDRILPEYLVKLFDSNDVREFISRNSSGTTVGTFTIQTAKKLEINLPSLGEQKRIIQKLAKIENIINNRKRELVLLDDCIKARFVEMFGALNNTSYETLPLGDICEFIKDGTHQTPTYTEDKVRGYKFLSSKDVTSQKISWSNIKYIPESLHNELYSKLAPRRGDILLAKNGTTGLAAIVDTDEVFDIYVSLALLRPKVGYNSRYLWAVINSNDTKMQFNANLKGIGVPNLHLGEIKKAKVIVPPLEQQEKFAVFLEQIDKSKVAIQKSLAETQLLFDKLMQDYFG